MTTTDSIFLQAVTNMLIEIFEGPPGQEAYVLNPGDPGLLRQLDAIDAETASKQPIAGKPSIAAHVDHLHFGLVAMIRWAAGEPNPWDGLDWNASWRRNTLDEAQWRDLRDGLRREAERWRRVVESRESWDGMSASAALSTAAHTAYHLADSLHQLPQPLDRPIPSHRDAVEERARVVEAARVERVEHLAPTPLVRHEPGLLEHPQVLHDRLARHRRAVGERGGGERAGDGEPPHDREPRAIAEREEHAGDDALSGLRHGA